MAYLKTTLLLPLVLAACAEGGTEDRPLSEVRISASHQMFGFSGLASLTATQVKPDEIFSDHATWNLFDNSTYSVTRPSGTSPPREYALETNGELTVLINPVDPRQSTPVFRGAYGLQGDTGIYFFTDRLITSASGDLGIFWGTRIIPGPVDLSGDWHLFSLHVVFSDSTIPNPDDIARAVGGSLTAAAGDPGTELALTGSGSESTSASLDLAGHIQDLGNGVLNLTVTYAVASQPATADERVFFATHGTNVVLALDADETDGEAGLLALVKKHDGVADLALLEGVYLIGAQTLFPNPNNPGSDAALGRLSLTAQNAFRMEMTGSRGIDFTYQGTFTLADDGLLTLTVAGTDETWLGAVDQDYNTVVIIDHVIEDRDNDTPELNLFIALREDG
jgi:hypothetical protein